MEAKDWFSVGAYLQVEGLTPPAWWSVSQSYSGLVFKSSHKVIQDFFVAAVPLWLHIEAAVADICWWQVEHKYDIFFHYITQHLLQQMPDKLHGVCCIQYSPGTENSM